MSCKQTLGGQHLEAGRMQRGGEVPARGPGSQGIYFFTIPGDEAVVGSGAMVLKKHGSWREIRKAISHRIKYKGLGPAIDAR